MHHTCINISCLYDRVSNVREIRRRNKTMECTGEEEEWADRSQSGHEGLLKDILMAKYIEEGLEWCTFSK